MGLAKIERALATSGQGCLGKAADDEPVFILRAQDILADALVDDWAAKAAALGCRPEKVDEARMIAHAMRAWSPRKAPD